MTYYHSPIIQQANWNALATMVRAMYEIVKYIVFKDLVIYIDDIIMFSDNYDDHVATFRKVLK